LSSVACAGLELDHHLEVATAIAQPAKTGAPSNRVRPATLVHVVTPPASAESSAWTDVPAEVDDALPFDPSRHSAAPRRSAAPAGSRDPFCVGGPSRSAISAAPRPARARGRASPLRTASDASITDDLVDHTVAIRRDADQDETSPPPTTRRAGGDGGVVAKLSIARSSILVTCFCLPSRPAATPGRDPPSPWCFAISGFASSNERTPSWFLSRRAKLVLLHRLLPRWRRSLPSLFASYLPSIAARRSPRLPAFSAPCRRARALPSRLDMRRAPGRRPWFEPEG